MATSIPADKCPSCGEPDGGLHRMSCTRAAKTKYIRCSVCAISYHPTASDHARLGYCPDMGEPEAGECKGCWGMLPHPHKPDCPHAPLNKSEKDTAATAPPTPTNQDKMKCERCGIIKTVTEMRGHYCAGGLGKYLTDKGLIINDKDIKSFDNFTKEATARGESLFIGPEMAVTYKVTEGGILAIMDEYVFDSQQRPADSNLHTCPFCGEKYMKSDTLEHNQGCTGLRVQTGTQQTSFQKFAQDMAEGTAKLGNTVSFCSDCGIKLSSAYQASAHAEAGCADETLRGQILDAAKKHTLGDRNEIHGDPIPAMELFMDLAQPVIDAPDIPKAMKGALILDAYKTARMLYNPYHIDSFEDKCAYAAIAGEAALRAQGKATESR